MAVVRWRSPKPFIKLLLLLGVVYVLYGLSRWIWRRYIPRVSYRMSLASCGLLKRPFVQLITATSISIIWETNCKFDDLQLSYHREAAYRGGPKQQLHNDAGVEHRLAGDDIEVTGVGKNRFLYRVTLERLLPDSYYHYQMKLVPDEALLQRKTAGRTTAELTPINEQFYFPGDSPERINVAIVGENKEGSVIFTQLAKEMSKQKPDMLVHLGGMVRDPNSLFQWQTHFFDPMYRAGLASKVLSLLVIGRNELLSTRRNDYFTRHLNYNAVTAGPVRFIVIDSNLIGEEQLRWLEIELSYAQRCSFRVALMNQPLYQEYGNERDLSSGEQKQKQQNMRAKIIPLLEKYRVDIVLSGHQRNYQRGFRNGIHYITSGGGGSELDQDQTENHHLFKVTKLAHHFVHLMATRNEITLKALDLDGRLLDELVVPRNVIRRIRVADN